MVQKPGIIRDFSVYSGKCLFILCSLVLSNYSLADSNVHHMTNWQQYRTELPARNNRANIATQQLELFAYFLQHSLHGKGHKAFRKVSKRIKNRITWRNRRGHNIYNQAFRKSYRFVKRLEFHEMPEIVMLIPYMESLWEPHKGHPASDYGYWQLVREVTDELIQLDYAPKALKKTHPDKIRSNAYLSTMAARMHLRRYYFYFAKVAKFSETDAWLLAMTSYNWGAGNTKRLIIKMKKQGISANFSNFYAFLYQQQRNNPSDLSLRAAVEYIPGLWHIAKLIKEENT